MYELLKVNRGKTYKTPYVNKKRFEDQGTFPIQVKPNEKNVIKATQTIT